MRASDDSCNNATKGRRHVRNNMGQCLISIQVFFPYAPRSCAGMDSRFVQAEARVRMALMRESPSPIGPGARQAPGHPRAAAAARLHCCWRGLGPAA